MSVEVVMPQMGESITEGTVSKWLKAVGDKIEKDEPILEISTDKVDAEVPSPGAGILLEIRAQEGETVEVGTVVAVIGEKGGASVPSPKSQVLSQAETPKVEEPIIEEDKPAPVAEIAQAATATAGQNPQSAIQSPKSSEATEVVMPQMGESITEGTVSKWL
ncbi:MAG: biotin/lipoyl-containing protein, partial [Actinomycetota bacterium]